jgi:hypothetical protein
MYLKEHTDSATPSHQTQTLLRNGAIRRAQNPLYQFSTALVFGTAAVGWHGYGYGTAPTAIPSQVESRDFELASVPQPLPIAEASPEPDTDDSIPVELFEFRESGIPAVLPVVPVGQEAAYDLGIRLVPPRMPRYRVRVRFRLIGEETPRIRLESDAE